MLDRNIYIPAKATKISAKGTDAVVYIYTNGGHPCARAFRGKSAKPVFAYRFFNEKQREQRVREFFAGCRAADAAKAARRAEKKAKAAEGHDWVVGTILVCSWGYSMTLVDFYRVVEVIGKATVVVEEIGKITVSGEAGYQGTCIADIGSPAGGKRHKARVIDGGIKIKDSSRRAQKWDGSVYSFNHMD